MRLKLQLVMCNDQGDEETVTDVIALNKNNRLLLDSRVVDVPMAYDPPFVMLSSLKPLFFNSLKHKLRFSDHTGA